MTDGMARVFGGDAADGTEAVHAAVALAEGVAAVRDDVQLLPWLALGPLFLRHTGSGRPLLEHALRTARAQAAVGALPFLLNLIARDHAATDHWAVAGATFPEHWTWPGRAVSGPSSRSRWPGWRSSRRDAGASASAGIAPRRRWS